MDMERPGFQVQPYLLQTSPEHVWEPHGPQFLLCSRIPPTPFLLWHPAIAFRNVCLEPLRASASAQVGGVSSPTPAREGRRCWGQGAGCGPQPPALERLSLSQCSHPVKPGACWRSAQGVLKGFHILFQDPLLMRALAMPSVPGPVRANEKPGTTQRTEWHPLASESGGGAGPWPRARGVSPGPPKISRSPCGGRTFGSQAGHGHGAASPSLRLPVPIFDGVPEL